MVLSLSWGSKTQVFILIQGRKWLALWKNRRDKSVLFRRMKLSMCIGQWLDAEVDNGAP
jgi:hypothetical protein